MSNDSWTHTICDLCWYEEYPHRELVRVLDSDKDVCCFCGGRAEGIFVCADPRTVHKETELKKKEDK